jgi:hypothetical protein
LIKQNKSELIKLFSSQLGLAGKKNSSMGANILWENMGEIRSISKQLGEFIERFLS